MAKDSEAKKRWMKENKTYHSIILMNKGDHDILEWIDSIRQHGGVINAEIKAAIREYMNTHKY